MVSTVNFSRPFKISFCDACPAFASSMSGSPDVNIRRELRNEDGEVYYTSNITTKADIPSIDQEDILKAIRQEGVSGGTCSVKVDLKTKEVILLSSSPWETHKCAKNETFADWFDKALEKAKSGKKSSADSGKTEAKPDAEEKKKSSHKSKQSLGDVTFSIVDRHAQVAWTDETGQAQTKTADLSKPTEGRQKFGSGFYSVKKS